MSVKKNSTVRGHKQKRIAGEEVTIRVRVTNTGDVTGSYEVVLKIDDMVEETRQVTLEGNAEEEVVFTVSRNAAGTYSVDVNGQRGYFTIHSPVDITVSGLSVSPAEAAIGEEVTVRVLVTNNSDITGSYEVVLKIDDKVEETRQVMLEGGAEEEVVFTASRNAAGTYDIDVNGLKGVFTVERSKDQVTSPSWWLIGGIVAGIVAAGLVLYFLARRKTRLSPD